MWIILSKLEKLEIEKNGSSKLSSNTKFDKIIEAPKETKKVSKKNNTAKKTANKNSTAKNKNNNKNFGNLICFIIYILF